MWPELREHARPTGRSPRPLRITHGPGHHRLRRSPWSSACVLGIVVASSKSLRSGVGSIITGLQTMPSVAWFPLAILLFGISEQAILFVVVLGAAPSIANGLIAGIDNVPPLLRRAGRVLGARGVAQWRHVMLPGRRARRSSAA